MTVLERETDVPALGNSGESCATCGAPLAEDQRYCLNCGERRGAPRVPFEQLNRARPAEARPGPGGNRAAVPGFLSRVGFVPLAGGTCVVLLAVLLGVVIGHGSGKQVAVSPAAAKPQVITIATAGAAPSAGASTPAFKGDWPDGKKGYTVQLQTLPKAGSDPSAVDGAKSSAESKGAGAVGALDSDRFDSLPTGNYVVYSGVFKSKAQAAKALSKLKKSFPGAKVIKVASGGGGSGSGGGKTVGKSALKDLQSSSPKDYSKKSRRLPNNLELPGKPPPKDNKKPGGGGGVQVIGG